MSTDKLKVCLVENQYIVPSFELYGGMKGFHDYGVLGIKVKNRLVELWRDFFLFENDIVEIDSPIIMPYDVLKASGHVDRFQDYIVVDGSGKSHRADHLLEDFFQSNGMDDLLSQVSSWNAERMTLEINKYNIIKGKALDDNPKLFEPVVVKMKNLMYEVESHTMDGDKTDFLRPELAQGIFINFKAIKEFTKSELPFGIAQVGKSYRKEISPTPFTRMREFTQAEIEFFIDPNNPSYSKVQAYMERELPLLSNQDQVSGINKPTYIMVKDALGRKMINHETMAYFLARMYDFAMLIGLDKSRVRFRQHLPTEMAHYANQCWDLECYVSGKWLECVGIADRGSYDLEAHSSTTKLMYRRKLEVPVIKESIKLKANMKAIGQKFGELTPRIAEYLNSMTNDELDQISKDENTPINITIDDKCYTIDRSLVKLESDKLIQEYEDFYPHTIEPSIGIDRLLYAVFEHNFWIRKEDEQRIVLSLPSSLTPYDVAIFPLHRKKDMIDMANKIRMDLRKDHKIDCYTDSSNTNIGKRYSRLDEMGVKYAITVDPGSLNDLSVTIRERDSMNQIRVPIETLPVVLRNVDKQMNNK